MSFIDFKKLRSPSSVLPGALLASLLTLILILNPRLHLGRHLGDMSILFRSFTAAGMIAVPGLMMIAAMDAPWKARAAAMLIFAVVLLGLAPALFFFSLYVSCFVYGGCL